MALLPILAIGALLLSSKKVRKEIGRFAKKVKKTLKKVVKSDVFKVIAIAALMVTGMHFVAGMMGAGAPATAASVAAANTAATAAAAEAGIIAKTATFLANGAKTAYTALANVGYAAGQSTTAFLKGGFDRITGKEIAKETVTGFDSAAFGAGEGTGADLIAGISGRPEAVIAEAAPFKVDPLIGGLGRAPEQVIADTTAKYFPTAEEINLAISEGTPVADLLTAKEIPPVGMDVLNKAKAADVFPDEKLFPKSKPTVLSTIGKVGKSLLDQPDDFVAPDLYVEDFEGTPIVV